MYESHYRSGHLFRHWQRDHHLSGFRGASNRVPAGRFLGLKTRLATLWLPVLLLAGGHAVAGVDVNRAGAQELQQIKGIGAKTAQRIIVERARGPFESLEHLSERLSGIGPKTVLKLRANGLCAGTPERACDASGGSSQASPGTSAHVSKRKPDHGQAEVTPEILRLP